MSRICRVLVFCLTFAEIGGFKIIGLGATGFTIDDFTVGGGGTAPPTVPEPGTLALLCSGLLALGLLIRFKPRTA